MGQMMALGGFLVPLMVGGHMLSQSDLPGLQDELEEAGLPADMVRAAVANMQGELPPQTLTSVSFTRP